MTNAASEPRTGRGWSRPPWRATPARKPGQGLGVGAVVACAVAAACGGCPSSPTTRGSQGDSSQNHSSSDGARGLSPDTLVLPGPDDVASTRPAVAEVATGHPRLWVRAADLPRLRSWAKPENKVYVGLAAAAAEARRHFDAGAIPGSGMCVNKGQYCESYALLFGFMSLLEDDRAGQKQWAEAARTILMHMIDRVNAARPDDGLAAPRFSVHDRSRWAGESFALTVDWIYPFLSAADKTAIRKVFLRWAEEQLHAETTTANHPKPIGLLNDRALLADRQRRRFAANNYYTAHMRNLGLMAMALDEADDPAEPAANRTYPRLRDYLANATGAWLYATDAVLRNDARGGMAPEGVEYAARTLAFIAQLYLALQTAGQQNPEAYGPQVLLETNPFFAESIAGFLHAVSPRRSHRGWHDVYEPAWYGDGESFELADFVDYFAPLGLYAQNRGDAATLEACRWIVLHTPPGGVEELDRRARAHNGGGPYHSAILYFLLLDPGAKPPRDPRPALPLRHFAPGLGHLYARTGWDQDATWFQFQLGWALIDHQHGDAGNFGLYRRGEWLVKERLGYGGSFENTDQHNAVTVENSRPNHADDERRGGFWKRGSQWVYSHDGDPTVLARSSAKGVEYLLGDLTGMYNSSYEGCHDVDVVTRAIVWLEPDQIVIYDRAVTGTDGRAKRFWLHTPAVAVVAGQRATVTTKGKQRLTIDTLLPAAARLTASAYQPGESWDTKPATAEPMIADLVVDPVQPGKEQVFLHVLQADDGKAAPMATASITGAGVVGAAVGTTALVFPVNPGKPVAELSYAAPAAVTRHIVTGLLPDTAFQVVTTSGKVTVRAAEGGGQRSDRGGVLIF